LILPDECEDESLTESKPAAATRSSMKALMEAGTEK